ncbi:MAG TPA: hypothetical protein VMU90_08930 [Solirubrobacteraceae bacterium]|nr:hypothetical protein [Solirubrobacteraceae bacterium]
MADQKGGPMIMALIIVGVVAIAGIAAGTLAAAGVFSRGSTTQTIINSGARQAATASSPATHGPAASRGPGAAANPAPSSATTSCGGDLSVGPNTSCSFAQNVEQAYVQGTGGDQDVTAFSPATGQTYAIHCTGGSPHVCSGGTTNHASIYFTSGPSPNNNSSSGIPSGTTPCAGDVSVGPNTSCSFAQNVEAAYRGSGGGDEDVTALSPATGQTYTIHCTGSSPHTCTGGTTNNASIYFP